MELTLIEVLTMVATLFSIDDIFFFCIKLSISSYLKYYFPLQDKFKFYMSLRLTTCSSSHFNYQARKLPHMYETSEIYAQTTPYRLDCKKFTASR